jgi:hypothetical protein
VLAALAAATAAVGTCLPAFQAPDHRANKDNPRYKPAAEAAGTDAGEGTADEEADARAAQEAAPRMDAAPQQPAAFEPGRISIEECMHVLGALPVPEDAGTSLAGLKFRASSIFAHNLFSALVMSACGGVLASAASVAALSQQQLDSAVTAQFGEQQMPDEDASQLEEHLSACRQKLAAFFSGNWQRSCVASEGSRVGLPDSCIPADQVRCRAKTACMLSTG